MPAIKSALSADTRARLHKGQNGKCNYCRDEIGIFPGEKGDPVLEHHTPRCAGGHRGTLVLSCRWCDKVKGMMHGREFTKLIRAHMVDGRLSMKSRILVGGLAKKRNCELQAQYADSLRAPWLGADNP